MSHQDAERRLRVFERDYGSGLVELASRAALPVVLNPDFVHLLRVNYFLDPPVTLPYAAEAELLLSPLCTEVDEGLYVLDPDLRDVLLEHLVREHGTDELRDVARLLWEYGQRAAPWPDRPGLPEAQHLSALNFIDPPRAQEWLARTEAAAGAGPAPSQRWFVAVRRDLADRSAAVQRAEEQAAAADLPIGPTAGRTPAPVPEASADHAGLLDLRSALIISASSYLDSRLSALPAAARNAEELAALLGDPQVGGFDVTVLRDELQQTVTRELEQFLLDRRAEDTALVYLSGHGLLNRDGRLIFATSDTNPDMPDATGLDLRWLAAILNQCRAQRQVVILDCSYSGRLADVMTTAASESDATGEHPSRLVLTASRADESALEEGFTAALADGLRTGAADRDRDGLVSVSEAFAYAAERLRASRHRQTPQITRSGGRGDTMVLARSPARPGSVPATLTARYQLNRLPGLDGVRRQLRELIAQPDTAAGSRDGGRARPTAHHLVFAGNPGTGKTTVARLIGEIYRDQGVLRRGHVVAASGHDLVSAYVGQTRSRTNSLVDSALDGVLFIDEAYALGRDRQGFAQEAIGTLVQRMDRDGDRLAVIMAGYPAEMRQFLDDTPGLRRRFPDNCVVTFEDYDPDVLLAILLDRLLSAGMHWTADLESQLRGVTAGMYRTRTTGFGNAWAMADLAQEIRSRWARRTSGDISQLADAADLPERLRAYLDPSAERQKAEGHVFISYVREDSDRVDQLQRSLQAAGISVWRDTADLRPGENWRATIRDAITSNTLVFLACFSDRSLARKKSYQNEELTLAVEQLRLRPPGQPWFIPVRFDDCQIPDLDIGGGRSLGSIQHADLFGDRYEEEARRLVAVILAILGSHDGSAPNEPAMARDRYISPSYEEAWRDLDGMGYALTTDQQIGLHARQREIFLQTYFNDAILRYEEDERPADRQRARDVIRYAWRDNNLDLMEHDMIAITDRAAIPGTRTYSRVHLLYDPSAEDLIRALLLLVPPRLRQRDGTFGINLIRTFGAGATKPHHENEQFIIIYVLDSTSGGFQASLYDPADVSEYGEPTAGPILRRQLNPGEILVFNDSRFKNMTESFEAALPVAAFTDTLVCTVDYYITYLAQ